MRMVKQQSEGVGVSKCCSILGLLTSMMALASGLVLNIVFRMDLYQMSVNFIYSYQSSSANNSLNIVYNLISILGNTIWIVVFLIVVHVIAKRKLNTIVYLFYIVINAYFISIQKQAFQDPRPFYYNTNVQQIQWTCPRSYGFPSGHSWVSVLLYEPVISDLIGTKGWKKLFLIFILFTGVMVPLSRMYLGSHSGDQIVNGLLHSFVFLILYKYLIQEKVYKLFTNIIYQRSSIILIMIVSAIFHIIAIAVPFIIYAINNSLRPVSQNYIDIMNQRCGQTYNQDGLEQEAGLAGSIIGLPFGFIYGFGLNLLWKFRQMSRIEIRKDNGVKHQFGYIEYMTGDWNYATKGSIFKYILIYVLCGGLTVGLFSFAIPVATSNFYGKFILQMFGYNAFGALITVLIPYFLLRFQLIQKADSESDRVTDDNVKVPKTSSEDLK